MRMSMLVVFCVAGAFLLRGSICAAATVHLDASASSDGWLSSWEVRRYSPYVWVIKAPWGHRVLLSFDQLRVNSLSYSCENYLEVRDGNSSWNGLLTRQCATSTPPSPIYSNGNFLYVKFYTSYIYAPYGVSANFRALPVSSPRECPKMLFGNNTGVIYSPGFPNNYPDRMDCLWTITAPDYKYLLLNFTELQLETGGCSDRVEVRDGRYSWNKQLESYCASQYRPQVLVPSGRWARVKFSSDTAKNARGFLLFIRFTDNYYETTAAPYTVWPTTPYYWWTTERVWWTTPRRGKFDVTQGWRSTPHLDFKQRTRAIAVPLAVGFVLALVIIAVVVCERRKRNPTPPPSGLAPRVVELQPFALQVPVPTPQHASDNPTQYPDAPRAALAGQPGG